MAPHLFSGLVSHRWPAWEIATAAGTSRHTSSRFAYEHLDSRDVYAFALDRLGRDAGAEVHLGVSILEVADGSRVRTSAGDWTAGRVYDALAGGVAPRPPAGNDPPFWQRFLGCDVEADRPVFDPGVATLMDFRVPQGDGLRFLYVLPFSPTRALVEDTSIAHGGPPDDDREALLSAWLGDRVGTWTTHHVERGAIPMGGAVPRAEVRGVLPVGTSAGAVRASSGYAFTRTLRHCRAVAKAVAAGREPPRSADGVRSALMDRVFLQALREDPAAFPEHLRRLVAALPADVFARFMDDASTPADELRVIAAMPKRPFAGAALRAARAARRGR